MYRELSWEIDCPQSINHANALYISNFYITNRDIQDISLHMWYYSNVKVLSNVSPYICVIIAIAKWHYNNGKVLSKISLYTCGIIVMV